MKTKLLLALPLIAYQDRGQTYVDDQAANGLRLWLADFDSIILACRVRHQNPPATFRAIRDARIKFAPLPEAYLPHTFAREIARKWGYIRSLIEEATHLHCAIGGLFGDWPSIFAIAAHLEGIPFAVWTDRVESKVARSQAQDRRGLRKLYRITIARAMSVYEKQIIRRSAIGLFHGMDCFEAYAPFCSNPHLVHNVHLGRCDQITDDELTERLRYSGPLRIVYAGRVHRDKGVSDWIETLTIAARNGLDFRAVWIGDGPELAAAREVTSETPIAFVGALSHPEVIQEMRQSDLFLFCHKTPESPRCLLEALICGLPLAGYNSPFPSDLIKMHGGGLLSERDRPDFLADALCRFSEQRETLTLAAKQDGAFLDAESVFKHRSDLMKTINYCTP